MSKDKVHFLTKISKSHNPSLIPACAKNGEAPGSKFKIHS